MAPAVNLRYHSIHRPHFRYRGRCRPLQKAKRETRNRNDGDVRHVQLATVNGKGRLDDPSVDGYSATDS